MNEDSPQPESPGTDGDTAPSLTAADTPETEHSNMASLPTPESRHSTMAISLPQLSSPHRPVPSAIRRDRSPPRNANNEIVCDHEECANKHPRETFRRLCEWNKHMDRHDRPYKCHEAGCELSLGFTYSGGLLRHQREVHKMHLSTKQPLYCPFPNCNRSSGTGFTRKENLEEHKRRRHLEEMSQSQSPSTENALIPHATPSRKRKRLPTPHPTEDEDGDGDFLVKIKDDINIEAHPTVKALRAMISQKDEIIRWQQMELQKYQNIITSLPQQALYSINSAGMMGAGGGGQGGHGGNAYGSKMS